MIAGFGQGTRGRHSTLHAWMRKNHAAIAQFIAEQGAPHWPDVARALAAEGLTDRKGQPPSVTTTKQTWYRVAKAVAVNPAPKPKPMPSNLREGEIAPGVWSIPPIPPPAVSPPVPVPPIPAPPASEPVSGTDQLEELRREMNLRSGRKPDA